MTGHLKRNQSAVFAAAIRVHPSKTSGENSPRFSIPRFPSISSVHFAIGEHKKRSPEKTNGTTLMTYKRNNKKKRENAQTTMVRNEGKNANDSFSVGHLMDA